MGIIDPNELKVKAVYPDAEIGVACTQYRAWFTVVRPSEMGTFWKDAPEYGTGKTMRLAWEDAAERLEDHSK